MTTAAAPLVTRPGLSFYVPGVRVLELSPTLQRGSDAGTPLSDILGDLLHAQVTRVNSGPSKYTLTFNNFFLTTAFDRAQDTGDPARPFTSERIPGRNPTWPRFKYNDFERLKFGQRLRIDMRYLPEPVTDTAQRDPGSTTSNAKDAWVPMVCGPVTDMRFTFGQSEGARLEVSGEDDLSVLHDKRRDRMTIEDVGELNVVRRVLDKVGYPLKDIAGPPPVPYPDFAKDNSQKLRESIEEGQAPYDLIQKLADRFDFEVFLEFRNLDDPASPLDFHFEPCRARAPKPTFFRLDRERDLLDFTPTIKLVDQYSEVRVDGRHRDPRLAEPVRGKGQHDIVKDELHGSDTLKSAGEAREFFFKARPNFFRIRNQSNLDPVRADYQAESVIRRKARECFTIEATTIGQPRLRPGQHVELTGLRPPFNGFYYVRQVVTTYGTDGLRTKITASRPGMELPPYNEPPPETP